MAYPSSLDNLTNPSAGQVVGSALIGSMADAIEALEAKAGITNSTTASSLDNRVGAGGGQYPCAGQGMVGWSYDLNMVSSGVAASASGASTVIRVHVPRAGTVSAVNVWCSAGGTVSASYAALYTAAGALMSQSASGGAMSSNAIKTWTLGSPQAVTENTYYYVMIWFTFTGAPSLYASGATNATLVNMGLSAPNLRYASADTGLTTTAPATMGTQTAANRTWFVGLT